MTLGWIHGQETSSIILVIGTWAKRVPDARPAPTLLKSITHLGTMQQRALPTCNMCRLSLPVIICIRFLEYENLKLTTPSYQALPSTPMACSVISKETVPPGPPNYISPSTTRITDISIISRTALRVSHTTHYSSPPTHCHTDSTSL